MNTKHIHDLTFRLCQALDQNYDVVNMDAVMSVISTLEGTTITKEQLEATRLAKFINHLRRRTKDEHLARRAKSLLKKWREMVGIQQQQQQVIETTPTTSSAALSHAVGTKIGIYQQQRMRSQSISPAASSMHLDTLQQHSNSSSSQVVASAITESIPRVTNLTPLSLPSMSAASANVHTINKRFGGIEVQHELPETELMMPSVIPTNVRKQPTSFENVLSGFGVTDDSNIGITSDNSTCRHKLNKPIKQIGVPADNTETFVIDQSSNSNSESLILPSNSRASNIAPIVIDIQDSNSGSNLVIPIHTNPTISTKMSSTKPHKAQSANLISNPSISIAPSQPSSSRSKKLKKDKKRKDKGDCNAYGLADKIDEGKNTVLLDETSSNQRRQKLVENVEKFTSFVNEDKSRLAYPEILSLLDNSSLSTIFPPEGSIHLVDEQNKVNLSTSNSSRTSFNLSSSDLTFAGKFKQGHTLPSTTSSNDLTGYNAHRRTASPKMAPVDNFSLQTGPTATKFMPFRDVGSNSNDSNYNSQASQMDLIDVVSNDKVLHSFQTQRKQDSLHFQKKGVGGVNISTTQNPSTSAFFAQKIPLSTMTESTILSASNATVSPEKKIPRKRGRKKGSKGVDSVIAKETSLTSQMLMSSLSSGSKKVKTTKELYTEMQNRKLGVAATSSSPSLTTRPVPHQQQQSSRPTSSCSEPSLQSPHTFDACSTNATMSTVATRSTPENFLTMAHAGEGETTSDTVTSEPSRDSSAIPKNLKHSLSIDSNSNSQLISSVQSSVIPHSASDMQSSDVVNQIAAIEKQLVELLKNLPPVQNAANIELKCAAELIPCTCKINEISPENNDRNMSAEIQETDIEIVKEVVSEHNYVQITSGEQQLDTPLEAPGGNIIDIPGSSEISEMAQATLPALLPREKPKKSIFDLDFDDDEDPLHTIKAEAAAASLKKENVEESLKAEVQSEPNANEVEQPQRANNKITYSLHTITQPITEEIRMPIFPTYEVDEDPQCVAKQRFYIQTQKIAKFHVDALHNCFIANVNGNWDNANSTIGNNMSLEEVTSAADAEIGCIITDGCNVVPKYGSLVKERIRKDLSHITFCQNYESKKKAVTTKQMQVIPFLGVARPVKTNNKKRKSRIHKICHKRKLTALKNCDDINDAEPQFNASKSTEEYKTDEPRICVSVIIADDQTDLTAENCNRTTDTEEITSKVFTDISVNPFDLATCAIVSKNNNVTLKDITVDVVGHGTDLFLPHSNELNESAQNGQNLLAIADHLDYSSKSVNKSSLIPVTLYKVVNATTEGNATDSQLISNDQQQYRNEAGPLKVLENDFSSKPVKNVCIEKSILNAPTDVPSANMIENISSRRSSSCSNSSLKQTQQSINLKLRRQFQEQKLLDVNGERKRRRKKFSRRCSTDNKDGDDAGQENKQPRIKRIKIAINGDVATQMQVSGGSSNNSTDEDNEEEPTDYCSVDDSHNGDEEIENPIKVDVSSEDVESINSAGSVSTTSNRYNLTSVEDENNYNDEPETGYDDYGDPDVDADVEFDEYEDGENYSGDFHEVVTRDISAPSTGSNHIVLTIKKTPSKTNSPSNSLSAMSPVILSNNTNSSQTSGIIISPIISKTCVDTATSIGDIDMNALIVKKLEIPLTESVNIIKSKLLSHAQTEVDKPSDIKEAEISSPKISFEFDDPESLISASPLEFAASTTKYLYKEYRKQRRRRKIKKAKKGATQCTRDAKLHHELFFPHELTTSDNYGIKHCILNISSCSSSCAEDSEYDFNDCVSMGTCESISRLSTDSQGGIKLETKNVESYETNHDISDLQQQKRSLPPSIYFTCDSLLECQVNSESCGGNNFGDPPTELADFGTKSCGEADDHVKYDYVDNRGSEGNEVNSDSYPTVNDPYSNKKNSHSLADTTGNKKIDNVDGELPIENNGLLHSFNNIFYTVDTLEARTNDKTVNNGNINESKDSHLMSDSVVVGPAAVDTAKQQGQEFPNKNCDDYNNLYNKNSNINLIRYYVNEPSLVTQVYGNKQSGSCNAVDQQPKVNYLNTGDDYNANTDVSVINDDREQLIVQDDNKSAINVGSTNTERKADKADLSFNISGENYGKEYTVSSSMQSCSAQVMLPHKEYRTGLRAVDEDVDDDDGNNCARIQKFKEWHEVLQLRSYNDELLTVLPYVVLD